MERKGKGSLVNLLRRMANTDTSLDGGIAPGVYGKRRVEAVARELADMVYNPYGSAELSQTVKTDWYPSSVLQKDRVSLEKASQRELDMKEALDDAVVDENRFPSEPGRVAGDDGAPCRVLKRRSWS